MGVVETFMIIFLKHRESLNDRCGDVVVAKWPPNCAVCRDRQRVLAPIAGGKLLVTEGRESE